MTKRASLFSVPNEAPHEHVSTEQPSAPKEPAVTTTEAPSRKYPVAKTRAGKRVATVYLEKEALRQLQKIAFNEETTLQSLLAEGVNAVFAARGLSRIA